MIHSIASAAANRPAANPIAAVSRIAANGVAERLFAAEAAIDAAIAAVAALTAAMPAAAHEAQVSMKTTQEALMHSIESCNQLVKSRTNIIRTHAALRTAQDEADLGNVMFGDVWNCPPDKAEASGRHLSVVAA